MDPIVIRDIFHAFRSLSHRQWLDASIINIWLLSLWRTIPRLKFRYIPSVFLHTQAIGSIDESEIKLFRSFFDDLPPYNMACPYEDLICVLHGGQTRAANANHFFVAVFNPRKKMVYLLGQDFLRDLHCPHSIDWESWNGRRIWIRLCELMGWDVNHESLQSLRLCSLDWKQNGYDCGPTSCQVVQSLMRVGMQLDEDDYWAPPKIPCYHPLRKAMAEKIHQIITDGCRNFTIYREQRAAELHARFTVPEDYLTRNHFHAEVQQQLLNGTAQESLLKVLHELEAKMEHCVYCHAMSEEVHGKRQTLAPQINSGTRRPMLMAANARKLDTLKGTHSAADYVSGTPIKTVIIAEPNNLSDTSEQHGSEQENLD